MSLECATIREIQDRSFTTPITVTDKKGVNLVKRLAGGRAKGYDAFIIDDRGQLWGFQGHIPFLDRLACRLKSRSG